MTLNFASFFHCIYCSWSPQAENLNWAEVRRLPLHLCPAASVLQQMAASSHLEPFDQLFVPSRCQVQIGCHTDNLSHARELKRAPVVTRTCDIACQKQSVSCLWGGLIYIVVPAKSVLGKVPIVVEGAVRAPFFKLGRFVHFGAFLLSAAHRHPVTERKHRPVLGSALEMPATWQEVGEGAVTSGQSLSKTRFCEGRSCRFRCKRCWRRQADLCHDKACPVLCLPCCAPIWPCPVPTANLC